MEKKEEILDKDSQYWKKNGYDYREFEIEEEAREHIELLKKPILRNGQKAHVGWSEEWLKGEM